MYLSTATEKPLKAPHLRIPRSASPYPGVRPNPWHNPNTEFVNSATAKEAIEAAGLNYFRGAGIVNHVPQQHT
jgi:hypothetical protein